MANGIYDIITVGGGLGGAALAKVMADHGVQVLVLERERHFKDRVRGEWMAPWGVAEARQLGSYELLRDACGHELPGWHTYLGPIPLDQRNLVVTTPHHLPALVFYHPAMQEVLLQAAADAGVEEHDRYYGVIHTVDNWFTELLMETGPEAEARRARALPRIAQDGTRRPDHQFSGPDLPLNETVRRRFFGEE